MSRRRHHQNNTSSSDARQDADPWWGDLMGEHTSEPPAAVEAPGSASGASRSAERAPGSPLQRIPLPLRPRSSTPASSSHRKGPRRRSSGRWIRRVASRPRSRRAVISALALLIVGVGFACSVGVITLNNVVIKRSAELGRLEKQRKHLRSENALISAEVARLAAPPVVTARARKQLKMVSPEEMPAFIWQDPRNQTITPQMRRRMERRAAQQAARRAARLAAQQAAGSVAPGQVVRPQRTQQQEAAVAEALAVTEGASSQRGSTSSPARASQEGQQ
jgi:cell division protein FtsL